MSKKNLQAILIDIVSPTASPDEKAIRLTEFDQLLQTLGGVAILSTIQNQNDPKYEMYIDPELLDEVISQSEKSGGIDLLIVNNILKPAQIYALSEALRPYAIEVWDRIDLILKIFARHAKSAEANLQIELARIRHMGPRIFGMGTELSRQGGGIGTSGIGETNTEIMKRHLKEYERRVFQKLEKLQATRELQRQRRKRQNFKTVALVGYTNAGKSSLMQALTHKENVTVGNAFFVTLETRIGRVFLPEVQQDVLLSDTIGFIADLPPELISAFTSTLMEAIHADLLLHVIDLSDPFFEMKITVVDEILAKLGIAAKEQLLVFNKTDLLAKRFGKRKLQQKYRNRSPLFLSAITKEGFSELKERMTDILFGAAKLRKKINSRSVILAPHQSEG